MKGSEALERVKKAHHVASIVMQLPHEDTETIEAINIIEKELKALDIIKNSGYISLDMMLSQNYITRKEYDLLKGVLYEKET